MARRAKGETRRLVEAQNLAMDELVAAFDREVSRMVRTATAMTTTELAGILSYEDDGVTIKKTSGNTRTLGRVAPIFGRHMDDLGYEQLVGAFTAKFPGQFRFLQAQLGAVSVGLEEPLVPFFLDKGARAPLAAQATASQVQLEDLVGKYGDAARREVLFGVAGLPRTEMAKVVAENLGKMPGEATNLGDTGMTVFFRSLQEASYDQIERDRPDIVQRFVYEGPLDKLTRPFCRRLLQNNFPRKRGDIEKMNNGRLSDPFVTGGGYRCRHQWILAPEEKKGAKAA